MNVSGMGSVIQYTKNIDLIYIGKPHDKMVYGKVYETFYEDNSDHRFLLIYHKIDWKNIGFGYPDNKEWFHKNDFITIEEFRDIKINKLLE